mgnify:CR=1 FL=1
MKHSEQWRPSKFTLSKGRLRGSRNPSDLQVSSRLVADVVARYYQEYLPKYAKGDLIDLGCGKVPLYQLYTGHVLSVTCVDWENSIHRNPFLDQTCDLNGYLPFADKNFDTILLSDVLEHISEPENLWHEMERILKPGGILIMNVPFYYKLHEIPYDFYRYTEYALQRFAAKAGFQIIVLESMGGIPEIVADLLAKLFFKIPVIGITLSRGVQSFCSFIVKSGPGRKISDKTRRQFPLGYFLVAVKPH